MVPRRRSNWWGMALGLLLVAGSGGAAERMVNRSAPDFARTDLDHGQVRLTDYRGKVVLLNFWATWCAPCQAEIPQFVQWQKQYGGEGLQVLGISIDDEAAPVEALRRKRRLNYPVVMGDAKLGELYGGVLGVPITFLIDRRGVIRARYEGETKLPLMEAEVRRLLAADQGVSTY